MKHQKHYRKLLFLLVMLSAATFGMAQQAVTVKDSITHEAIPFVSVYFGNESGGYTDEQGSIVIPNGAKQIRLSHICYETKSVTTAAVTAQTIFLVPKSINLGEVAVVAKSPKRIKVAEVGLTKAKTQTKHKGANGFEMASTTVLGQKHHTFIPYWQVSITPPIIWFSRKSRILSMPLSALTSVCQMPRPMPPKTSP